MLSVIIYFIAARFVWTIETIIFTITFFCWENTESISANHFVMIAMLAQIVASFFVLESKYCVMYKASKDSTQVTKFQFSNIKLSQPPPKDSQFADHKTIPPVCNMFWYCCCWSCFHFHSWRSSTDILFEIMHRCSRSPSNWIRLRKCRTTFLALNNKVVNY